MQKLIHIFTLFTLSSFISIGYAESNQPINSAESFSNMVKANQKAAKEAASAEVGAETHTPAGPANSSAADQATNTMNSANPPSGSKTPTGSKPATPTSPAATPTTPAATAPTTEQDPYSGYTGKSDSAPESAGTTDEKKSWNLGY